MSKPDHFIRFSKNLSTETITANNAGTDVAVPPRKLIGISVDGKSYFKFSRTGTNAAATDTLLPAAGIYLFDTGPFTVLSLFADSGGNVISSVFECFN